MKKIVAVAIITFVTTLAILKLLESEMPEWMRDRVNRA